MQRLADKVALITGAGSGIGREVALGFAAEGATVFVVDIDKCSATIVADQIRERGGSAMPHQADCTSEEDHRRIAAVVRSERGRLDILDNNVGACLDKSLAETTVDEFHRLFNVNVLAALLACKHMVPLMLESGGGSIINMASLSGLRARPHMPLYASSKGAVVALTRSLAIDFGEKGIRANCICPAAVDTPMLRQHYASVADGDAKRKANEASIPLGRIAQPKDVVGLAVYLASDASEYVSGQIIAVDGGSMAGTIQT